MRFNNLLNRLKTSRIYGIIAMAVLIIAIIIALAFYQLLRVSTPMEVFDQYLSHLQAQDYGSAAKLIHATERDEWLDSFYQVSTDTSPENLLKTNNIKYSDVELVSQATVSDEENIIHLLIFSPDTDAIFQSIQADISNGIIDLSDPEIVRIGENRRNVIIYYAADNVADYEDMQSNANLAVHFRKEQTIIGDKWYVIPTEELHQILTGNVEQALDNNLASE